MKREPWYGEIRPDVNDPLKWEWGYLEQEDSGIIRFSVSVRPTVEEIERSYAFRAASDAIRRARALKA